MRKIILTLIFSCVLLGNAFAKDSLTILNAGSKTGSFAMQMTAVSKDLQKHYDIDLKIPGDYCTALQMLKNIEGPVLMPWANDFEAIGRDGNGCATFEVKPAQVVRYDSTVMCLCSVKHNGESLMKNQHTVGHTMPAKPFKRALEAINNSFGAKIKPIAYDGSGATKTGLYNGEVDYGNLAEHCWNGDHENPNHISRLRYNTMYLPKIKERLKQSAPKNHNLVNWGI